MTKIDALRRFLLPCFFPTVTAINTTYPPKKRLSTSLRSDIPDDPQNKKSKEPNNPADKESQTSSSPSTRNGFSATTIPAPPRPSKSMVIGTIFGHRRGHVWFCIQTDRLSIKPFLLLEFPILTHQLVNEMRFGLVRIALESNNGPELEFCSLRQVPVWTMFCNGRKLGFALRRKATDRVRSMLKTMRSTTVGIGVLPSGFGSDQSEEVMYMRANYEHMVGSADSESFHLINPDECPGQELSIFLLRSRNGISR